jgi:polyferredoxin
MLQLIRKNKTFLLLYCIILIAGLVPVLLYSKADIHLFINEFHSPFFDTFFRLITHLGSGITAAVVAVLLLFIRIRYSFILSLFKF